MNAKKSFIPILTKQQLILGSSNHLKTLFYFTLVHCFAEQEKKQLSLKESLTVLRQIKHYCTFIRRRGTNQSALPLPYRACIPKVWYFIKSLGVVIDSRLTFDTHVRAVCKACNYHKQALRHVRHCIPLSVAQTLAWSIVGSHLDYCNSVLYGAPKSSIAKLQRAQNMLARVVLNKPRRAHSTELLQSLHWLPVKEIIDFKVALLTYKVRHSATPDYLNNLLSQRVINSSVTLRSSSKILLHSVLEVGRYETVCHTGTSMSG